ncbi:MAG: PfkB family carbohydrate kinase, partial [Planctomycetota bacterium]
MPESNANDELAVDVALFGETMLRLSPPSMDTTLGTDEASVELTLETATTLQTHVGGSESNTAVGLAGLGHSVAWISRLNQNPIGCRISREIADHN